MNFFRKYFLPGFIFQSYGTVTWGFWLVFILPVLTLGVWKIVKTKTF